MGTGRGATTSGFLGMASFEKDRERQPGRCRRGKSVLGGGGSVGRAQGGRWPCCVEGRADQEPQGSRWKALVTLLGGRGGAAGSMGGGGGHPAVVTGPEQPQEEGPEPPPLLLTLLPLHPPGLTLAAVRRGHSFCPRLRSHKGRPFCRALAHLLCVLHLGGKPHPWSNGVEVQQDPRHLAKKGKRGSRGPVKLTFERALGDWKPRLSSRTWHLDYFDPVTISWEQTCLWDIRFEYFHGLLI